MIPKQISKSVVVVGTDPNGRGGIATVIACQKAMMESFNFIKVHQAGFRKFILPFTGLLKAFRYAPRKYRIVHIHTASYSDFFRNIPFVLLFKLMGKKVLLHIHGGEFEKFHAANKRTVNFVCRKTDALATVSTYFVKFLQREHLNRHVELLHNSIAPTNTSHQRGCHPSNTLFLSYFGAIDNLKGVFDVIEAVALCKKWLDRKIEFHIGGKGDTDRMNAMIERLGLQGIVIYDGWLGEKEKTTLLEKSDIFLQPSVFESFGISILEALGHGVPVITTAVGGITDLVTDRYNGLVVEPGNVAQIADAIKFLADHPDERKRLGENALLHARNFHHDKIARDLQAIYQRLLD